MAKVWPCVISLVLLAAGAGCTVSPPKPPPTTPPTVPPHVATPRPAPAAVAVRPPPAVSRPPATQKPAPPPTSTAAPPLAAPPPATLVGLSQADVRTLLGNPATAGEAGAAQIWTYRAPDCSLTVAFFYDVVRGAFFALTARADPAPEPACLTHLYGMPHAS